MKSVVSLLLFVLIGVLTAAVGELQFSVFIRGDWLNLRGSMVFNAVYLTGAFVVARLIFRLVRGRMAAFLLCVALAAAAGLAVEWFVIGNSPWDNPAANQPGMAAYWACMVIVPLIAIDPDPRLRPLKRAIVLYGTVYTLLALLARAGLPRETWGYVYHIWSVVLGYVGLLLLCVVRYGQLTRTDATALPGD